MDKAAIHSIHFDMDGVISNTEAKHVAAEQQTCRDYNLAIDPRSWAGFKGKRAEDIFAHLIKRFGDPDYHSVPELIEHKTNKFIELAAKDLEPIDGVLDFLAWSRSQFQTVNLVTSSNRRVQEFIVGHFGIAHLFDHMVTGDDVENGKPDPEPYQLALDLSGSKPESSVVIEDSTSGIASALGAKCLVVALTTSHSAAKLQKANPTYIANNFEHARWHLDPSWGKYRVWHEDIYGNQGAMPKIFDQSELEKAQAYKEMFEKRGHHQTYSVRPYLPGEPIHITNDRRI